MASLSTPVLHTKAAMRISPSDRAIDAGDHAGTALEAAGKFHHHLTFFIEGVKVGRAGIDAEAFLAGVTDILIQLDMSFPIVFKGIQS